MSFASRFESYTIDWQSKYQEDEWYFAKIRDNLTSGLQPHEAFIAISEAVYLTIQQSDEHLCLECFQILLTLSRISGTTEMPPILDARWEQLCDHVSKFSDYHKRQVDELRRWYRSNISPENITT